MVVDGEPALATAPWSASEALLLDPATLAVRRAIEVPAGSWNAPVSVDIAGGTALIFALHDQTLRARAVAGRARGDAGGPIDAEPVVDGAA